ncbi:MAG: DUF4038 domain-containing protein [Opitutaceae bacterium]|nr:DUF4038 domain-containing protein [Opitutaceae bacterium]
MNRHIPSFWPASRFIRSILATTAAIPVVSLLSGLACLQAQTISWSVPADGGTPRDPARIVADGAAEFRIRASVEEGRSPLKHAVSRIDLICRNESQQAATVTVHLDLSGDGKRTDFDSTAFGGMATRDFVFIQPPGKPWQQVNGTTAGWISTVSFVAAPGETRIGLGPSYSYADLLRWVNALPSHPHLDKHPLGKSDGGRDHWELTITDPAIALEKKQKIFWHAREHAYETFSSFAMEGLIEFLLADAAAEFRRRYVISLHPMTNVDGVAQGHEYRGGYDFPDPHGTATGRLTFAAMDRLRPDFAVAWHNWIAPRDQDVVFYTDGEKGGPTVTARAWHLFTQRFPSPRATGHRWRDDVPPEKFNWHGRRPLNEANVHQYAMKRYGTSVWGWEMPWWNRTTDDARRAGAGFAGAFFATLDDLRHDVKLPPPVATVPEVPRWEMHEFVLRGRSHVANPFRDAALVGEFTSPSGKTVKAEGFFNGDEMWRLRFAPDEQGEWRYLLRGEGVELFQRGALRCTAPLGRGFIGIHPQNPYAFAYADGSPFFPMGDTCYGLACDGSITDELRTHYLKTRRAQRFNFVRMQAAWSQRRAQTDPAFWPFGGTPQEPDLDRFNPAYFRHLDGVLEEMRKLGMNAELIALNFYQAPMNDPRLWTQEREQRWLRHLVARYGALDNVFLWTLANEYETHPDGQYRLDRPGDPDWAKDAARFIKKFDPYGHLVTVHPLISASARGSKPGADFEAPWRIGEFFGPGDAMDVISQQTGQEGETVAWDEKLQCFTGNSPTLVASLLADRCYRKPVLNSENGYEYLRDYPSYRRQVHHTDKVRRSSWRIASAGGYFATGFAGTLGMSDSWNRKFWGNPKGEDRYTFSLKDEGAGAQLGLLHDFFTALSFWRMQPFAGVAGEAVALAEPGEVYAIYLPHGGTVSVDLTAAPGDFAVTWLNPISGEYRNAAPVPGGQQLSLSAPWPEAVLHLKARRP